MVNKILLKEILESYKQDFVVKQWADEKYKWEAVQCFQDNWDVKAVDFVSMLKSSLNKTQNLLTSINYFPSKMIIHFAQEDTEKVRAMFIALFDENNDVIERIEAFKTKSTDLLRQYGNGANNHYQKENSISTYLWLRYPEKYYIYKFSEVKIVAQKLSTDYTFKKGAYANNLRNSLLLYNEICNELKKDEELVNLLKAHLTPSCYHDPELKTLTIDVGFYISHKNSGTNQGPNDSEITTDYSPEISLEQWIELIHDTDIFTATSLEIMKRFKDYGGEATCTQLAKKYGENKNFYNTGSVALAKRVANKSNCPLFKEDQDTIRWWPILYTGRQVEKDEEGSFVWKLRGELAAALDRVDLSKVPLYAASTENKDAQGHWWLNANPKIWSFSELAVGEEQSYTLYNENGNKRRIFQNFLDAKVGDQIIGYESNPIKQIVALGKIVAGQDGQKISIEKTESLSVPIDYQTLKEHPELERMEYFRNPQGSLFKITNEEFDAIMDLIREENPVVSMDHAETYGKKDFLKEVYMAEVRYDTLVAVLKYKKNIILQGPPGVGKTFAAKRLAYSMIGVKDDTRIELVQFHQSYSYEDFMMGYKPADDGFELKSGIFYRFCQRAASQPDKDFFFIIDEINRGNLSKIFGELLMLLERDYRGTKVTLAYSGMSFFVPKNLYIIGMMNTADRSLAMIDYALRRRFSFFELDPGFDSDGFLQYKNSLDDDTFNELIEEVKSLNKEISQDKSLGKGFCIGHSYFCGQKTCTEQWLEAVVKFEILPMLGEYWFDDSDKLERCESSLLGVFQ